MRYLLAQILASLSEPTGPAPTTPMDMETIHSQSKLYHQMMTAVSNLPYSNDAFAASATSVASATSAATATSAPSDDPTISTSRAQDPLTGFSFPNDMYNTSTDFTNIDFGFLQVNGQDFGGGPSAGMSE